MKLSTMLQKMQDALEFIEADQVGAAIALLKEVAAANEENEK